MPVTVRDLATWKVRGERFAMLTAYDALTAQVLDEAGIPVLLVGDSAGMVVLGHSSTLPVTMEDMLTLTAAVARGARNALIVADLPFGSYQASDDEALRNAAALLKVGAHAVKLEGGARSAGAVRKMTAAGIPVMGHLGLTPQSVNAFGGFRVQGRGEQGEVLVEDAMALQEAGCFAIVLECVPADLAGRITKALDVPTIGIGAGPDTDGQVLVISDLLGLTPDPVPRFVKRYANLRATVAEAARRFAAEVAAGEYPGPEHQYH